MSKCSLFKWECQTISRIFACRQSSTRVYNSYWTVKTAAND